VGSVHFGCFAPPFQSTPSPLRGGIKGGGRHAHRTMASEHCLSMVAVGPDRNHLTHRVIPAKTGIHPDLSQPVAGVGTSQDGSRPRRDDTVDVEASEMNLPHKGVAGTPDIRPPTHPRGKAVLQLPAAGKSHSHQQTRVSRQKTTGMPAAYRKQSTSMPAACCTKKTPRLAPRGSRREERVVTADRGRRSAP